MSLAGVNELLGLPAGGAPRATPRPVVAPPDLSPQEALEQGLVVLMPRAGFRLRPEEASLLRPDVSDGSSKNISFDPATGRVRGSSLTGERLGTLSRMVARFSDWSAAAAAELLPAYAPALERTRTSFRPCEVDGRALSARKDDRRLHVDAFPSQPVQGRRILRLFTNIDPEGRPRIWNVGEPFERLAERFLPRVRRPPPLSAALMQRLGLTSGRRSPYDELMLGLHDLAKGDETYQASAPRTRLSLASGTSWVAFTDITVHAAIGGRCALEQTFLLPVEAMADASRSPLRILERMTGRTLA